MITILLTLILSTLPLYLAGMAKKKRSIPPPASLTIPPIIPFDISTEEATSPEASQRTSQPGSSLIDAILQSKDDVSCALRTQEILKDHGHETCLGTRFIDHQDAHGKTALMYALQKRLLRTTHTLIQHPTDILLTDTHNSSLFMHAALGNVWIIITPLHEALTAIWSDNSELYQSLILHTNDWGLDSLSLAAGSNSLEFTILWLELYDELDDHYKAAGTPPKDWAEKKCSSIYKALRETLLWKHFPTALFLLGYAENRFNNDTCTEMATQLLAKHANKLSAEAKSMLKPTLRQAVKRHHEPLMGIHNAATSKAFLRCVQYDPILASPCAIGAYKYLVSALARAKRHLT